MFNLFNKKPVQVGNVKYKFGTIRIFSYICILNQDYFIKICKLIGGSCGI